MGGGGETCCLGLLYCFKNLKSNGQSDKARSSWDKWAVSFGECSG